MKVAVKIDAAVKGIEVLITAKEKNQTVDELVGLISDYGKKRPAILTVYQGDRAFLVDVTDILRIYAGNQKVYVQTLEDEYVARYRLYELEELLACKNFLRISNSEIININRIYDIDLSISGRICIRFGDSTQTYVSRRYIPRIKKSLGI